MKLNLRILFLVFLSAMVQVGCEPQMMPEPCNTENRVRLDPVQIDALNFEICSASEYPGGTEAYVVIRSQSEFDNYIFCSEEPPGLDFGKYVLIAGKYTHPNCALFDSQELFVCGESIFYEVEIIEQVCQAPTEVFFWAVVPRVYKDYNVILDINLDK